MPLSIPFPDDVFPVHHRDRGVIDARLRRASCGDVRRWKRSWKPALGGRADAAWNWSREIRRSFTRRGRLCAVVECEDELQAILSIDATNYRSDARDTNGSEIVYIEYVASAPWNDKGPGKSPIIEKPGMGRFMLAVAARISQELGFDGRIALHSKPDVEWWYRDKIGLQPYGERETSDGVWPYFEGDRQWAELFLSTGGV